MKGVIGFFTVLCIQTCLFAQIAPCETGSYFPEQKSELQGFLVSDTEPGPLRGWDEYLGSGIDISTGESKTPCVEAIVAKFNKGKWNENKFFREVRTEKELHTVMQFDKYMFDSIKEGKHGRKYLHNTSKIIKNLSISEKKVTIIGGIEYYHGNIEVINKPYTLSVDDAIRSMYNNYYDQFCKKYGEGYISEVELGERLYFSFQLTMKDSNSLSKSELSTNLELLYKGAISGKLDAKQLDEIAQKLKEYNLEIFSYSTGNTCSPKIVKDFASFEALQTDWRNHLKDAEKNKNFTILGAYWTSYASAMETKSDHVGPINVDKIEQWSELKSKIGQVQIKNAGSSELVNECNDAMKLINTEMEKCRLKKSDARMPLKDEFWKLQTMYEDVCNPNIIARYFDASNKVTTAIWTVRDTGAHNEARCTVGLDYVLVGGGAWAEANVHGGFLTASYPLNPELRTWVARSKDQHYPDPHTLHTYAIGMKLAGVERDTLLDQMKVSTSISNKALEPSATAILPAGYQILGGGAHTEETYLGNLLFASYPQDAKSWKASAKTHITESSESITVYAIGIKKEPIPGFGNLDIQVIPSNTVTTVQGPTSISAELQEGYALASLGAHVKYTGWGIMLMRMAPHPEDFRKLVFTCKDHHVADPGGQLTGYTLQVKKQL